MRFSSMAIKLGLATSKNSNFTHVEVGGRKNSYFTTHFCYVIICNFYAYLIGFASIIIIGSYCVGTSLVPHSNGTSLTKNEVPNARYRSKVHV